MNSEKKLYNATKYEINMSVPIPESELFTINQNIFIVSFFIVIILFIFVIMFTVGGGKIL